MWLRNRVISPRGLSLCLKLYFIVTDTCFAIILQQFKVKWDQTDTCILGYLTILCKNVLYGQAQALGSLLTGLFVLQCLPCSDLRYLSQESRSLRDILISKETELFNC